MQNKFWERLKLLLESSELVIDRPKGSAHPKYPEIIFPLDYGYLKNTSGGDGNEVDVWRGSLKDNRLDAIACTMDLLKRDVEIKLIVGCTEDEIEKIHQFHQNPFMSAMIIRHP
jgi:inorganic pyrophosphatase